MNFHDSDDLFADTRMSFGEHLEELRTCLWRAIFGFIIALVASFWPLGPFMVGVISQPVKEALVDYYLDNWETVKEQRGAVLQRARQQLDENANVKAEEPGFFERLLNWSSTEQRERIVRLRKLNEPKAVTMVFPRQALDGMIRQNYPEIAKNAAPIPEDAPGIDVSVTIRPLDFADSFQDAIMMSSLSATLTSLGPAETFMVYFKVCMITGFVISSPWVFYQIWKFVGAGLYPHEKKLVHYYLPLSIGLFLGGVVICQFIILPAALGALMSFNAWLDVDPNFRLNEWLSFAIWMPVITGACFQTPLVMLFLGKLGIFTAEDFAAKRRIAWFVMLIVAAIISPSVDAISLFWMWVPMCLLFELGIVMVRWSAKPHSDDDGMVPYQPEESVVSTSSNDTYHEHS